MKNKIVIVSIIIALLAYIFFDVLKGFPEMNAKYHMVFLSMQVTIALTSFAIALFAVFGYSLLTYGVTFIAYKGLYSLLTRAMEVYTGPMDIVGTNRIIMYVVIFGLTFLTFYILRKCKVNLDTDLEANKKVA